MTSATYGAATTLPYLTAVVGSSTTMITAIPLSSDGANATVEPIRR